MISHLLHWFKALVFFGCTLTSALVPASAAEVISRFDSLIELAADGTLTVTETIQVQAEGNAIKRGIYRDIPLRFEDAEGQLRQVGFKLLSVRRDGREEPHFTERSSGIIRIYAGEKGVLL